MVDSLYYSSRKIPESCENHFVDYRIYYQKRFNLMRQITNDLNPAIVHTGCLKKMVQVKVRCFN